MKILIIARSRNGSYAPFVMEQIDALKRSGLEVVTYGITNSGFFGYLKEWPRLKESIRCFMPDIIHAHYGLCGVLANFQRRVPVVTTYHGSDINDKRILLFSKWSIRKSAYNIFVSQRNINIAKPKERYELIPCGISIEDYPTIEKAEARQRMNLTSKGYYVLFAGAFDNKVKNSSLAKAAIQRLQDTKLLELKGYSRAQVATLMQAVNVLLMTSITEGSPQVIKEAMACGCPIVSVDVGDVREQIEGLDGCFISERHPDIIAGFLKQAFSFAGRTKGRDVIIRKGLTNDIVASRIISIYKSLV